MSNIKYDISIEIENNKDYIDLRCDTSLSNDILESDYISSSSQNESNHQTDIILNDISIALNTSKLKINMSYRDRYCPQKDKNNCRLRKYADKYLLNVSAFYLDSFKIRTTKELLKLGEKLQDITMVEANRDIYKKIKKRVRRLDNAHVFNHYLEEHIERKVYISHNLIYLDSMTAFFTSEGGLRNTIKMILSRLVRNRVIFAFTTPLRNPYHGYEELYNIILDDVIEFFIQYRFDYQLIVEERYSGQASNCRNMMFCLFLLQKKE
jgi:hypothetical protein